MSPANVANDLDDAVAALFARIVTLPDGNVCRARLREQVIEAGLPYAVRMARHYQGRGEAFEDLVQVATVGLIKAVDGYDQTRGPFSHYAAPTIRGELKKHFRDRGWRVRVPRRLQELRLEMTRANEHLTHQLGRSPTVDDLAAHLRLDAEEVLEGLDLARAYQPVSLDAPVSHEEDAADLGAMLGGRDPALERMDDQVTLATLLPRLPAREQRIMTMRFYGNMTQSQIAAEIGISQMHVSRLLSQALAWLRAAMTSDIDPVWPGLGDPVVDELGTRIEIGREPGGVTVTVHGEVDRDNAADLRASLCRTAMAERPRWVRADFAQVPLIDAAGIAALVAGCRTARHAGARFAVVRTRPVVADLLRRAGVWRLLSADARGPVLRPVDT
ncbi:MAG TPA: SigB/SigF/SigG family RNA polymerase sigma factor [Micromonosporaceae bacterium]